MTLNELYVDYQDAHHIGLLESDSAGTVGIKSIKTTTEVLKECGDKKVKDHIYDCKKQVLFIQLKENKK